MEEFPKQKLEGKIIPNTCINIAMNEESQAINEHVSESRDNLVFFFPLANNYLNAACVHRDEITEYSKVFFECERNSMSSVLTNEPYYQLHITQYPIYVTRSNYEMIKNNKQTQFFLVYATQDRLTYTVSQATYMGQEKMVSADHCQDGSQKRLSIVYPVDPDSIQMEEEQEMKEEFGEESQECEKITKFGLNCLNDKTATIMQNGTCSSFCKSHYSENLFKLIYLFTRDCVGTYDGRQYEIAFDRLAIEDASYKNVVDISLESREPRLYRDSKNKEIIADANIVDYLVSQPWINLKKFRCLLYLIDPNNKYKHQRPDIKFDTIESRLKTGGYVTIYEKGDHIYHGWPIVFSVTR
jgi:hypothetical protein